MREVVSNNFPGVPKPEFPEQGRTFPPKELPGPENGGIVLDGNFGDLKLPGQYEDPEHKSPEVDWKRADQELPPMEPMWIADAPEQTTGKSDASENKQQMQDTGEKSYPRKEVEDGTTFYYDENGNLYRIDDNLLPNNEYDINGYHYETDEEGRIVSAEGRLQVKDHEGRPAIKDSIEDIGKGDQKETDDRGHLIGDQFNGSNGMENMIPQDSDINRKDYKALETELAKEVAAGKEVYVKVEPIYEGDSHRPVAVMVTYTIDGEESVRVFPNEREE